MNKPSPLPLLPAQPAGTPWPTDRWPEGDIPKTADRKRLAKLIDHAFSAPSTDDLGETHALVVVQHGRLILERYNQGFDADRTYPSWSKAKSITQALTGILVGDGMIDIMRPADVPEWCESADDPRRAITLDLLLRMSSGLRFIEEYTPENPSDTIEMLWGRGKEDVAHFAASFPLEHAPGSYFSYSSGTTNIVSRALSRALDAYGPDFEAFMRKRLFDPIGMKSAIPKFDPAGTFIGSSYCFATARDFARFGLLYLRGGSWDGRRILPEGWVDYARTPTWQQPETEDRPYGAHWWLGIGGPGAFSAVGFQGQYTVAIPDLDMVIVRHGKSSGELKTNIWDWLDSIADCFRSGTL